MSAKRILTGIIASAVIIASVAGVVGAWHASYEPTVTCDGFGFTDVDVYSPGTIIESWSPAKSGTWQQYGSPVRVTVNYSWSDSPETGHASWTLSQPEGCEVPPPPPPPCDHKVNCEPTDPQTVICIVPLGGQIVSVTFDDKAVDFTHEAWNKIVLYDGDLAHSEPVLTVTLSTGEVLGLKLTPGIGYDYSNGCYIQSSTGWEPGFVPASGSIFYARVSEIIPCPPAPVVEEVVVEEQS